MLIPGTNSIKDTGYTVANSCRFNSGDSARMHKTPGSTSNQKTWTYSAWIKRGTSSASTTVLLGANVGSGNRYSYIGFSSSEHGQDEITLLSGNYTTGSTTTKAFWVNTNDIVYRDFSAWYHIVVSCDLTESSAGDVLKVYVNNVLQTTGVIESNATVPDDSTFFNTSGVAMEVGALNAGSFFDGYMAEVCWIDGTALTPSSFGEADEDSPTIWKPKDVSGLTFGTNGFYLDYKDSANLGNDANGGTDLTEVNLAATDQSTDTCTNNFATLNPLATGSLITLSEGNLKATGNNASDSSTSTATIGITGGKFYWEAKIINTVSGYPYFGIYKDFDSLVQGNLQGQATGTRIMIVQANASTTVVIPGTDLTITAPANTNIMMFAVDKVNNKFYLGVNGAWYNSGDPTTGATGTGSLADLDADGVVMFGTHHYNASAIELNFGNPPYANSSDAADANGYGAFEYAPPSGYLALCTKNLGSDGG